MDNNRFIVQVYVGDLSTLYEALSVEASKQTTAEEIVSCIVERLTLNESPGRVYELAEVIGDAYGQECKERSLSAGESPVQLMLLWPKARSDKSSYRFYLREKVNDYVWRDSFVMDPQLIKDYFHRFLYQPKDREYPDLCQLPDLNEQTLLANLKDRFAAEHIYTYVGSILIAVNPFKFYPIYNPKYVKLYQNQNKRLGSSLPPHIFAIADTAYLCMLKDRQNQCIVISGESGSGKTESTNFLLHHLTALSQKGSHGSGVEQTILSAGPVLEAFGNARTAHNNNSSRFGKFIQVNYKENGMVHGAVVQKYLLEKSRICRQGRNERNYHVFYYLLEGASEQERVALHLKPPDQYYYLNKTTTVCGSTIDDIDKSYEFSRLKQSMEMVGFTAEKQRRLFAVLSAVLLLGNVEFQPRKSAAYHHDEAVGVRNPEVVQLISELLRVKQETLLQALTAKRARASGETLVINYRLPEAIASRDAMAKCLYGALFDWIVLQVNHALLSKKDTLREHQGNSIGVLDIFGFEDFGLCNSFEQLCINYANEHLQYYFNQHVFKYEQEEYRKEGIRWTIIDFMDNTGCLHLIEGKPNGLLCLLDDQCNFPGATNDTLLQKFNTVHKENHFYQKPQRREPAFIVVHYAGTVKYQAGEMREKNLDLMRQDIVGVLKNSSMAFVRELVGADPVAVFRWAIVRAFFRACFAFQEAGRRQRQDRVDGNRNNVQQRYQRNHHHVPNENIISKQRTTLNRIARNHDIDHLTNNRLSWPQLHVPSPSSNNNNNNNQQQRSTATTNRYSNQQHVSVRQSSTAGSQGTSSTSAANSKFLDSSHRSVGGSRLGYRGSGGAEGVGVGNYERMLYHSNASSVMQKANQIVMKNKSFRPRERSKKGLKNLQSVKTLAGRTSLPSNKTRNNKPMTVTAQFQQSLHSLMDTLNQANPFFIRCIKSNAQKIPNHFDEDTVQRQLRYTGMLETVRIRQAGFNVRLTYDEFIQLYRILLPKGLLSSQHDVRDFLSTLNLNRDNYQLGSSKVFLRESEKYKLDSKLHQQIMASIVTLQRWFRACLERRRYLRMRNAAITIQASCRMYLVQKYVRSVLWAVVRIQRQWRGFVARKRLEKLKNGVVVVQARIRGWCVRKRCKEMMKLQKKKGIRGVAAVKLHVDIRPASADEAFISKSSSQDELEIDRLRCAERGRRITDSDETSNFLENLETSNNKLSLRSTQSLPSVTQTNVHHPTVLPYCFQNLRLENTDKEGILLDSTLKRRISKASTASAKTIDLSDIDLMCQSFNPTPPQPHTPHPSTLQQHTPPPLPSAAQGSIESIMSSSSTNTSNTSNQQYSFESHHSNQPSYQSGYHHPHYRKDSSDSDYSCAPPPSGGSLTSSAGSTSYLSNSAGLHHSASSMGMSSSGYVCSPLHDVEKTQQQMSSLRSRELQHQHQQVLLKRSYGMVQQQQHHYRTAEKALQVLGATASDDTKPKVPSRGMRRTHVKSLGEEVPDSGPNTPSLIPVTHHSLDKNLRPIAETINPDFNNQQSLQDRPKSPIWTTQTATGTSRGITSLSADLKRRNSDPAATNLEAATPSKHEFQMIEDTVQFVMYGHRFRKTYKFNKNDKCAFCCKDMDSFTAQGHKCTDCKKFAHITCIQNNKVTACENHKQPEANVTSSSKHGGRRKYRKHGNNRNSGGSSSSLDPSKQPVTSKFSLTGMSEFTDSTDQIISDGRELKSMQDFISKKISQIESSDDGKKQSGVDLVFKQALREFKDNLVQIYSTANKNGFETCNVQYKDLITNFEQAMETVCQRENKGDSFPVTMGVNAFRGFMNEFMTSRAEPEKPSKTKRKKEKKRKAEDYICFAGHTFVLTIINIPMACEICSSFFMWPIERGLVCQSCKVTCHKKCYIKSTNCTKDSSLNADGNKKLFGASLHSLIVENNTIPAVIEKLLSTIELGLYTEGLYRKSGVSSKVRELKNKMEENPVEINFKDYQIHVLASVFKGFLREMPEPLLTFDCYENFITAANMKDQQDRVATLYDILRKLPKPNYDLMERLTYHLARVALHEERNRMSAASLAIVFAPCILRTNKIIQAQDSLQDISSQTQCIETIISEKLRKLRNTLDDIDTLDSACQAATKRLSSLRSSKVFSPDELMQPQSQSTSVNASQLDDEENIINDHLQEMEKEKDHLTSTLPNLTHANSDDDMLSTDGDGSTDDISCVGGNDPFAPQQHVAKQHRPKAQIIRSISGGGGGVHSTATVLQSPIKQLKRQLSSDVGATSVVKVVDEAASAEDAPIMV